MALLVDKTTSYHIVAIPYPGRGHINPMMNFCRLIALRRPSDFTISLIVTEEWLGMIGLQSKPSNIRFATIPNVIPSQANPTNFFGFHNAIQTKMEDPVEQLLHRMKVPVSVIIYDSSHNWVLNLGRRMNIPVASLFTMSATVFSTFHHYDLLVQNGHVGENFLEHFEEEIDYIPGVPPIRVGDLGTLVHPNQDRIMRLVMENILMAPKAQFLLFVTFYELEAQVIDVLKSKIATPIYAIGPAIPHFDLDVKENDENTPDYIKWLDCQSEASVLYISQGSFLSVSEAQLDEIIAGVQNSGVPYIWIARGDQTSRFESEKGLVISWCDQLKLLCHSSVGAFWSHCGWNSTNEGAFSGVPMLTFPIGGDQFQNRKMIVEDWKMGKKVMDKKGVLVSREEIAKLITSFMNWESQEGKKMRQRAREVKKICQQVTSEEGSAQKETDSFISDIVKNCNRKESLYPRIEV